MLRWSEHDSRRCQDAVTKTNQFSSHSTRHQVAEELTAHDVIRAHARDELGIDLDDM